MSRLGASSSSPRSARAFWETRPLKSICPAPELFDHVRRGAVHEARLQGLVDLLRRRVLDLSLWIFLLVHGLVGLGILFAEATVEDDHLERRVLLHAERVLRALGPYVGLAAVALLVAAAEGAAGQQTGGGGRQQAGRRRTTQQVTSVHSFSSDPVRPAPRPVEAAPAVEAGGHQVVTRVVRTCKPCGCLSSLQRELLKDSYGSRCPQQDLTAEPLRTGNPSGGCRILHRRPRSGR